MAAAGADTDHGEDPPFKVGGDGGAIAAPSDPSSAAAGIGVACEEMADEEADRMSEDGATADWLRLEKSALTSQTCHVGDEMAYAKLLEKQPATDDNSAEEEMAVHGRAMEEAGLETERKQLAHGAGGGNPVNAVAAVGTDGELPCLLLGLIHLTVSTLADWQASADWQACPNYRLPDWSKPRFVSCADYRRIPSAAQAL